MADVTVVELPKALATSAAYGLTVLDGANPDAYRLALFILSPRDRRPWSNTASAPRPCPEARRKTDSISDIIPPPRGGGLHGHSTGLGGDFVALCLLGSAAHSQGMLGVGISDSQVDPKGAFVGTV